MGSLVPDVSLLRLSPLKKLFFVKLNNQSLSWICIAVLLCVYTWLSLTRSNFLLGSRKPGHRRRACGCRRTSSRWTWRWWPWRSRSRERLRGAPGTVSRRRRRRGKSRRPRSPPGCKLEIKMGCVLVKVDLFADSWCFCCAFLKACNHPKQCSKGFFFSIWVHWCWAILDWQVLSFIPSTISQRRENKRAWI